MLRRTTYYRLNQQIQADKVRLIDALGKQVGILSREEALRKANAAGVDLVEIAPNAKPPVAKIVDFKKFLYQEAKRKREERKKARTSETKEIRLGPFTFEHDLGVKMGKAREFLREGNKVKIVVKFTGRQMAHPEFGRKTMNQFLEGIATVGKIDADPQFAGRFYWTLVAPTKHAKKEDLPAGRQGKKDENEDENKKVSE